MRHCKQGIVFAIIMAALLVILWIISSREKDTTQLSQENIENIKVYKLVKKVPLIKLTKDEDKTDFIEQLQWELDKGVLEPIKDKMVGWKYCIEIRYDDGTESILVLRNNIKISGQWYTCQSNIEKFINGRY